MIRFLALAILSAAGLIASVQAQSETTLTYQGQLDENGIPANAAFDLEFSLWNAEIAGNQSGPTNVLAAVPVIDGQFSVELDFGAEAFDNTARWLEIAVEGVTLLPRQPITRAPYSIQTRGIFVDELGRVGLGTSNPLSLLHVDAVGQDNDGVNAPVRIVSGDGSQQLLLDGNEIDALADGLFLNNNTDQDILLAAGGGKVGIGTLQPQFPLHLVSAVQTPALVVHHTQDAGIATAIEGRADAPSGRGVLGVSTSSFGAAFGVRGETSSSLGAGIAGFNFASGGSSNFAVLGQTFNPNGYAGFFTGGRSFFSDVVGIGNQFPASDLGLHVAIGSPLTLASGGFVQCGDTSASNLAFDDNEIMARINGFGAAMFLNRQGGNVGIATGNPVFTLTVNGSAGKPGGGSWSAFSDRRLKKNVEPLKRALDRILALHGVSFEYTDPDDINELPGRRIGMIAQDVEAVFPGWVDTSGNGYKTVTYRGFEALTVEAFRELCNANESELASLHADNARLNSRVDKLEQLVKSVLKCQTESQ